MSKVHESTCAVAINARHECSCESKTPRTDSTWDKLHDHACSELVRKQVLLDQARQLETELNECLDSLFLCLDALITESSSSALESEVLALLKKHGRIK